MKLTDGQADNCDFKEPSVGWGSNKGISSKIVSKKYILKRELIIPKELLKDKIIKMGCV